MHQALPPASFVLAPRQGLMDVPIRDPLLIPCKAVCHLRNSGALPPTPHDYSHQRLKRSGKRLPRASKFANHAAARGAKIILLLPAIGGSGPDAV